jgi:hypothetical protein
MHALSEPAFPATIFLRSPSSSGNLSLKNLRALSADAILAKESDFLADPQKHAFYFSDGTGFLAGICQRPPVSVWRARTNNSAPRA